MGGYAYHKLFLKFTSPFINTLWRKEDYCKFIQNPLYFLNQSLQSLREADFRKNIYPVGEIGENDNKVRIEFVHARNFQEAETLWERRKKRVNYKRIFVKFGFDAYEPHGKEYLKIFDRMAFPKICFYSGDTNVDKVVYLRRFEWQCYQGNRMDSVSYNDYCRNMSYLCKDIDILKLLNGEEDYIREQ